MSQGRKLRNPPSLAEIARFLIFYFGKSPYLVAGAYFFIFLSALIDLANPYAYGWLVDISTTALGTTREIDTIIKPILALTLLSCGRHITMRCAHFINCYTDTRVHREIAADAVKHVHSFETEWHTNTFAGSIVTAIKRGRSAAHRIFDTFCYDLFPAIIVLICSIALTWQKSQIIALSLVVYAICFTTFSLALSLKFVAPKNRIAADEDSRLGGAVADSVTGYSAVKASGAELYEYERIKFAANRYANAARIAWIRANLLSLSQNIVINIGRIVAMGYAAYYWSNGTFSAGDVMFILTMQRVLADYLDGIGNRIRDIIESINDLEEVVTWRIRKPTITNHGHGTTHALPLFALNFNKVTFTYSGQNTPAIKDFSLEIHPGEKVALVGKTGSGKSTLFKLLHRYYQPQQGIITIDDHSIEALDLPTVRRQLALVSQEPVLFHRSLAENIAYSKPEASLEEIKRAAELAQIAERIESLPAGYETLVGERGIKLSGGERQRVAIARAILADSRIILLDEATSSLDNETEKLIQKALAELTKGRSVLAIAHRITTIQDFDRIVMMDKGSIIEMGTHQELVELNGLYSRLLNAGL
jgi:ATP-binding cassette subfamily B protein